MDEFKKDIFTYQDYKFLLDCVSLYKTEMLDTYVGDLKLVAFINNKCQNLIDKVEQYIYEEEYNKRYFE